MLLFPGCFNPPHQGHLALLWLCFQSIAHLNPVAAIIIPRSDEAVTQKTRKDGTFALPLDERVKLWRSLRLSWAWPFCLGKEQWSLFHKALEEIAGDQNVQLRFVLVGGPDGVGMDGFCMSTSWRCKSIITSDVSRSVDFRCPTTLRQLPGCTPWKRDKYDDEKSNHHARRFSIEIAPYLPLSLSQPDGIFTCATIFKPKITIRYIRCRDGHMIEPISSTVIRQMFSCCTSEIERDKALEKSLNATLLKSYLLAMGSRTHFVDTNHATSESPQCTDANSRATC